MRNFQKLVAVLALSGLCLAAPVPDGQPAAKKSTKHKAVKPVAKDETAEKLRQLKETVDQQQAAMQQMQQQLQQTQQQLQKTQSQLTSAQQTAQAADAKATTVETNTNMQVKKVQSDLSDVKAAVASDTAMVMKAEKKIEYLEHPASIAYKGVTLTPGAVFDLQAWYRTHATQSDDATNINAIPLEGQAVAGSGGNTRLSEFAMNARNSRLALRANANAGTTKLTGVLEFDFTADATGSNPNQTSGWAPRMRQYWGRAQFANGFAVTTGQTWTMISMNRKGTQPDAFWHPNSIDQGTMAGVTYGRWGEVRFTQDFAKAFSFGLALEMPSYLSGLNNITTTTVGAGVSGLAAQGTGANNNSLIATCTALPCADQTTYSTGLAPDLLVKLTYDNAVFGHWEAKALGRFFRNRVPDATNTIVAPITPAVAGHNNTALGWGVGGGTIIPVLPKKVDFVIEGFFGQGISRYQAAGAQDFVVRSTDRNMQMIKGASAVGGFETHPNNRWEINALFGGEYYGRSLYPLNANGTGPAGYGVPNGTNTGCYFEVVPTTTPVATSSTCLGNNRAILNGKVTAFYDLLKGPYGILRYGLEFNYYERLAWSGTGNGSAVLQLPSIAFPTVTSLAPKGNEKVVTGVVRYILP